jgi:hypothetical protein
VYVSYADDPGNFAGVYKTTNGGDSWTRTNDAGLSDLHYNFGWYFGNVCVHPLDENTVYVLGVLLAISRNGGFGRSTDYGFNWSQPLNQDLFITQFYAGCINLQNPRASMGGTQDNGTIRTRTGNVHDWEMVNGGDGFHCVIDYTDTNYQYAEYQWGSIVRTTDSWRLTAYGATAGIDPADRHNWSTPIVIDPQNPRVLYTGTQRVYMTTDRAVTWKPISPDLSNGYLPRFGGYTTITTIDVAPLDSNTIMAGTDDANVWVSTNPGGQWTKISGTLPNRWVTQLRFDPSDRHTAYVTLSGYKVESKLPHVFRTTDLGASWQDISSNLPEAPVNVLFVDLLYPHQLYVGTDVGAFYTTNTGATWMTMGSGLPNSSINDMQIHSGSRIARAFTHGRSLWELNLDELVITAVPPDAQPHETFSISNNYPNPFNPSTTLEVSLSTQSDLTVTIYDLQGKVVRVLTYRQLGAGTHAVAWDGKTDTGVPIASGIYLCQARVGSEVQTRRIVLLR